MTSCREGCVCIGRGVFVLCGDMVFNFRHLRKYFTDEIVRDLTTSTSVQSELEKEWQQMVEDRKNARTIFPTGNSKVTFVCNLAIYM